MNFIQPNAKDMISFFEQCQFTIPNLQIGLIVFFVLYFIICFYKNKLLSNNENINYEQKFRLIVLIFSALSIIEGLIYWSAGSSVFLMYDSLPYSWIANLITIIAFIIFYISQIVVHSKIKTHFKYRRIMWFTPFVNVIAPVTTAVIVVLYSLECYVLIPWLLYAIIFSYIIQILLIFIKNKSENINDSFLAIFYILCYSFSKVMLAIAVSVPVTILIVQFVLNALFLLIAIPVFIAFVAFISR